MRKLYLLLPLFGCLLFIVLYIIATLLYPGGSQADVHSKGFSWMHNYWCNLLNEKGLDGRANGGRVVAIIAMASLAITLIIFWNIAAQLLLSKIPKRIVQVSGVLSMAIIPFLSSAYHDVVINISGLFGLTATFLIYAGIYKKGWTGLFWFGIFNLVLVAINNYMYYVSGSFYYLPLIQKITFITWLLWICLVDIKLYLLSQQFVEATTTSKL